MRFHSDLCVVLCDRQFEQPMAARIVDPNEFEVQDRLLSALDQINKSSTEKVSAKLFQVMGLGNESFLLLYENGNSQ